MSCFGEGGAGELGRWGGEQRGKGGIFYTVLEYCTVYSKYGLLLEELLGLLY